MPRPDPILDDKLVQALARGGLAPLVIEQLDKGTATGLRHRLYRERLKMRSIAHPDTEAANKAVISIQPDQKNAGQYCLVIYPANLLIEAALEKAGISVGDPPPLD